MGDEHVIGHLGSRASALLDGQMSDAESERAWEHVHACHACRDLVEREGWVKTRLAGLDFAPAPRTPDYLKGSLLGACAGPPGDVYLTMGSSAHRRRPALVAIGGGAVGAAVMGVLALGAAPADAPTFDRRAPVTSISPTDSARTPAPSQQLAGSVVRKLHAR